MTAEQLEELQSLKDRLGKDVFYGEERIYNMRKHNPLHLDAINMMDTLARRVIAAEKLVEALEISSETFALAGLSGVEKIARKALSAYRDASK